jgi:hypothetical protein
MIAICNVAITSTASVKRCGGQLARATSTAPLIQKTPYVVERCWCPRSAWLGAIADPLQRVVSGTAPASVISDL